MHPPQPIPMGCLCSYSWTLDGRQTRNSPNPGCPVHAAADRDLARPRALRDDNTEYRGEQ